MNLRLLHNVDTDVLNMMEEDALEQALDEADAIASGATIECDDATSASDVRGGPGGSRAVICPTAGAQ